jgi:cation diffusion facilitator family transporter
LLGDTGELHPILVLFLINLASAILKYISVTGTNAMSAFLDLLNDIGDSVGLGLLLVGLRYWRMKQSMFYPFGARRALYVLGLLSIMIFSGLLFGVALFKAASILSGSTGLVVEIYSVVVFLIAFAINIAGLIYIYIHSRGSNRDPALSGGMLDSISDTAGSSLALFTLITRNILLDVVGSLVLTGVILISGITIGYRYFQVLIGRAPPREILKKVMNKVLEFQEVRDVNVFNASMITEDEYMLILEVEVDKDMEVEDAEKLSARIEEEVKRVEPRFKHVVIEFVSERAGPKTYGEIIKQIDGVDEE